MYENGDEVVVIFDSEIKLGTIYDYKDCEYRVADGPLEDGKFTFSGWVEEDLIAPKSQLFDFLKKLSSKPE